MATETLLSATRWAAEQLSAIGASLGVSSEEVEQKTNSDELQRRREFLDRVQGTYRGRSGSGKPKIFTFRLEAGADARFAIEIHNTQDPLDTSRNQIYGRGYVNEKLELLCEVDGALRAKQNGCKDDASRLRIATVDADGGLKWRSGRRWMKYDLSSWTDKEPEKGDPGDPMPLAPPEEEWEMLGMSGRARDQAYKALGARVGVSMCLVGRRVRHNGGDCGKSELLNSINRYAEFVPVCPEYAVGMGVPREPVRLVVDEDGQGEPMDIEEWGNIKLMGQKTGLDATEPMWEYSSRAVEKLRELRIDGMILKSKSPTCGMRGIPIYKNYHIRPKMKRKGPSMGMFAHALTTAWPELPAQEEGALSDMRFREKWVTQVFTHARWRRMREKASASKPSKAIGFLADFHRDHKLLIRAILGMEKTRELGQVVSLWKQRGTREEAFATYYTQLFTWLNTYYLSPDVWASAVQRMVDRMKLDDDHKQGIREAVEDFQDGLQSKSVPLVAVKMALGAQPKKDLEYLSKQILLHPYPKDLRLASHVPPLSKDGSPAVQRNPK